MTRRDLAKAALGSAVFARANTSAASTAKPNIVLMLTDNPRYGELGVYGGGILRGAPTPRIDKLATEGMRLLNFNVEAQCTPSRSALMTGRYPIRSGTHSVPRGGVAEGLTLWEVTLAQLLSGQGYATGIWGKWHLGSSEARLPTNRGFDEWYGIPRTYTESLWPSLNESHSVWPSVGSKQGWDPSTVQPQPIYEARKGEKARQVGELGLDTRRNMEKEITTRAVSFIKRNASAGKPFFAYIPFSLVHQPTLPNPEFAGKTGNGDWADCLAEMDYRAGQVLDAIKEAGIEENTIVIFTSDNGPEATHPWEGDSGPWRGTYFTAMEASLRAPFIIRWPGKVPVGQVNNEIVHILDLFTTLAHAGGAEIPKDRPIDGVDQMDFFLGKQEKSNRGGFVAYVSDRLHAVKWRNWKMHLIWQVNMYDPPIKLPLPKVVNLLTDLKEERAETIEDTEGIIFMPSVLKEREVAYFWLPAALESISVGEIAKLVLFNLRVAAQDWKRANPLSPRNVILVVDELQGVAGENLQGILQDARSFGIHAILANQSLTDLKSQTGFDLAPTIMTNTRVKFFFTSPSERECYVYVERGKGFTEARQFPEKGNPWLKDLGPEEFAYHVCLAWPFSWKEYQRRDALPLPSWDEIPGGDFYKKEVHRWEEEEVPEPVSDVLPRNFALIKDAECEEQVAAIKALFRDGYEDNLPTPFDATQIPPNDILQVRDEILASIADRGNDRSRCVLRLLFDAHLAGRETTPTWKELWEKCWNEPLGSQRGADVQPARTVTQAVYRIREILDRYFASDAGQRFSFRVVIEQNKYRLQVVAKSTESEEVSEHPFLDSQFPES